MRKTLVNTAGLIGCLLSSWSLQAATVLTFEVVAQHTERAFGTDTTAINLGTKTFLVDLAMDESAFYHTNVYPGAYPALAEYYNLSMAPLVSASGFSEDAKASFVTGVGFNNLSLDPIPAHLNAPEWNHASIIGGKAWFDDAGQQRTKMHRQSSEVQESPTVDGPEGAVDMYTMTDSLRIAYDWPTADPNLELDTFDEFEAMLASSLQSESLFDFSSRVYLGTDWCIGTLCGRDSAVWTGQPFVPPYGEGWVEFEGTATLVGISEVPLPGAAWLMLLALGGLAGTKKLQKS